MGEKEARYDSIADVEPIASVIMKIHIVYMMAIGDFAKLEGMQAANPIPLEKNPEIARVA